MRTTEKQMLAEAINRKDKKYVATFLSSVIIDKRGGTYIDNRNVIIAMASGDDIYFASLAFKKLSELKVEKPVVYGKSMIDILNKSKVKTIREKAQQELTKYPPKKRSWVDIALASGDSDKVKEEMDWLIIIPAPALEPTNAGYINNRAVVLSFAIGDNEELAMHALDKLGDLQEVKKAGIYENALDYVRDNAKLESIINKAEELLIKRPRNVTIRGRSFNYNSVIKKPPMVGSAS